MKQFTQGFLWKVLWAWLQLFMGEVLGNPLLGPDIMEFDSVSPFSEWEGPAIPVLPHATNPLAPGVPTTATGVGTGLNGPDPRTNIIQTPCVGGQRMDVTGCRREFVFPSPNRVFRGDTRLYRRGPNIRARTGRVLAPPPRTEPETPDPEQIRGDD